MTDNTLVTIDRETLPAQANNAARVIAANIGRLVQNIHNDSDRLDMMRALIVAANESSLDDCDNTSIMIAAFNAVELGLRPGKTLGLCYFVPKREHGSPKCQLWIGFKGLTTLAKQYGSVKSVHANVVLIGEDFAQWTDEKGPHFKHAVPPDRKPPKPDQVVGAYCVSQLPGGGSEYEWMSRAEIDRCRPKHKTPIWDDHYDAMAQKTVIKRASKNWVLHGTTGKAIELDNQAERGEVQTADIIDVNVAETPESSFEDFEPADDHEGPPGSATAEWASSKGSATAEDMSAGMQEGGG